ncbi:MAG: NAD+ synthase [Actinomycetota bacterium]|nr:NAD+ synthase [Actinomycetota bacterium]
MTGVRCAIAQLNVTIGDVEANVARMVAAAETAASEQAQLVIFSEMSVTGYLPGDLLDEPAFLKRANEGVEVLRETSRRFADQHWVIGAPLSHDGPGKGLHNALIVLHRGEQVLSYAKQLLPSYNVFNEHRYFDSGPDIAAVLSIAGHRVGFLICEDGWNDETGAAYLTNPLERLRTAAPDIVISINASPSSIGKREDRHRTFAAASARSGAPIVYVNQVGGHDQLVYDGASFVADPTDGIVFEARRFDEDVTTLSLLAEGSLLTGTGGGGGAGSVASGLDRPEFYRRQIVLGLQDYARRCGFAKAVVGSSGGIDSALTVALAVEALGHDNVSAVTMPSRFSSAGSVDDSVELCRNLGVVLHTHPIVDLVDTFVARFESSFGQPIGGLALQNLQARIRGTILMEYSNQFGHLLLTTGNKSELSVGYCTLYGDTNGGLSLIGDLYKTEVFELCRHLNVAADRVVVPVTIIEKEPSAELAPDQRDTDSLPPYPVLDEILKVLIEGEHLGEIERADAVAFVADLGSTEEGRILVDRVRRMIWTSEYKRRQAPPIIRVRSRAFGAGRQMPIAARYG